MTVNVLKLFCTVSLVSLQCVVVVFPDHTHLLYARNAQLYLNEVLLA